MNTDKPYKLRIHVTKDVLKRSMLCGDGNYLTAPVNENCAIALAVRAIFPKAKVGHRVILPDGIDTLENSIGLPYVAEKFIKAFDALRFTPHERVMMPELSFEVLVPPSIIDAIGLAEVKAIVEKSETLELV